MQFVQFTEINDHEGETWHFWLQLDGNEREITKLSDLLDEAAAEATFELDYTLTGNIEPENVVDKLVQYADSGYMATHNKVTGKFTCPEVLGDNADNLYKGGICAHFVKGS